MGVFKRLFGRKKPAESRGATSGGAYKQCDACGKLVQASTDVNRMNIFTATIDHWSLEGMAGYCPSCGRFLCSEHLEWKNESGEPMGPWVVACSRDSVAIRGTP